MPDEILADDSDNDKSIQRRPLPVVCDEEDAIISEDSEPLPTAVAPAQSESPPAEDPADEAIQAGMLWDPHLGEEYDKVGDIPLLPLIVSPYPQMDPIADIASAPVPVSTSLRFEPRGCSTSTNDVDAPCIKLSTGGLRVRPSLPASGGVAAAPLQTPLFSSGCNALMLVPITAPDPFSDKGDEDDEPLRFSLRRTSATAQTPPLPVLPPQPQPVVCKSESSVVVSVFPAGEASDDSQPSFSVNSSRPQHQQMQDDFELARQLQAQCDAEATADSKR